MSFRGLLFLAAFVFFFDPLELLADDVPALFFGCVAEFFVAEFGAHHVAEFVAGFVREGFVPFAVFFGGATAAAFEALASCLAAFSLGFVTFAVALHVFSADAGVADLDLLSTDGEDGAAAGDVGRGLGFIQHPALEIGLVGDDVTLLGLLIKDGRHGFAIDVGDAREYEIVRDADHPGEWRAGGDSGQSIWVKRLRQIRIRLHRADEGGAEDAERRKEIGFHGANARFELNAVLGLEPTGQGEVADDLRGGHSRLGVDLEVEHLDGLKFLRRLQGGKPLQDGDLISPKSDGDADFTMAFGRCCQRWQGGLFSHKTELQRFVLDVFQQLALSTPETFGGGHFFRQPEPMFLPKVAILDPGVILQLLALEGGDFFQSDLAPAEEAVGRDGKGHEEEHPDTKQEQVFFAWGEFGSHG